MGFFWKKTKKTLTILSKNPVFPFLFTFHQSWHVYSFSLIISSSTRACNAHYLHANGEPLLKRNSFLSQFAKILLVVWSANGDGSALTTSEASSNLLNDDTLTDAFVRVIVSFSRTNRARCALYMKILDLLDEESISGESSGRASL